MTKTILRRVLSLFVLFILLASHSDAQFGFGGQFGFNSHPAGKANYISYGGHLKFPLFKDEFMIRVAVSKADYKSTEKMNAVDAAYFDPQVISVVGTSTSNVLMTALDVQFFLSKKDTLSGGYGFLGFGYTIGTVEYEIDGYSELMSIGVDEGREPDGDETFARLGGGYEMKLSENLHVFMETGVSIPTTIIIRTSTTIGPLRYFTGSGFLNGGISIFF